MIIGHPHGETDLAPCRLKGSRLALLPPPYYGGRGHEEHIAVRTLHCVEQDGTEYGLDMNAARARTGGDISHGSRASATLSDDERHVPLITGSIASL